jgi:hypothetical protein
MKRMVIDRIGEILADREVDIRPCLMNMEHKSRFFIMAGKHWNGKRTV